jgi:hypothetical protein
MYEKDLVVHYLSRLPHLQKMSRPTLANHPAVSFTVKRPLGPSRGAQESGSFPVPGSITRPSSDPSRHAPPLALRRNGKHNYPDDDSSGEDAGTEDEIITGFDSLGVQRCVNLLHAVFKSPA